MFELSPDSQPDARITVYVDGRPIDVAPTDTVATALLLATGGYTRTSPVTGERRAPYCMMGACFECLTVIDGVPSRQGCLVTVAPGMRIERQHGPRTTR